MFNWKSGLLSAVLFAAVQSTASALDVDEIVDMVNSGVQEAVIINMLEQQKLSRPLTAQEVINLSRAGVSARLMEELTSVGNVRSAYAPAPVATYTPPPPAGNYATSSSACGVAPPAQIVVETPATVVAAPPRVYHAYPYPYYGYYGYPYRYSYGPAISFGFGYGYRRDGRRPHGWHGRQRHGPPRWRR